MANSLRAKISKLRHDRNITEEEYQEIISKLDGHDKQIRTEVFDECIKFIKDHSSRAFIDSDGWGCTDNDREDIFKLFWLDDLEQLKEQNNE